MKKVKLLALAFILTFAMLFFIIQSKNEGNSMNVGLVNGELLPCPNKPNCVCSFSSKEDTQHFIEPLSYQENPIAKIKETLESLGLSIQTSSQNYIHSTQTSFFFRFVDDIEFYYDEQKQLLHFRSASRVGHSDFGVNRKRIEQILKKLASLTP